MRNDPAARLAAIRENAQFDQQRRIQGDSDARQRQAVQQREERVNRLALEVAAQQREERATRLAAGVAAQREERVKGLAVEVAAQQREEMASTVAAEVAVQQQGQKAKRLAAEAAAQQREERVGKVAAEAALQQREERAKKAVAERALQQRDERAQKAAVQQRDERARRAVLEAPVQQRETKVTNAAAVSAHKTETPVPRALQEAERGAVIARPAATAPNDSPAVAEKAKIHAAAVRKMSCRQADLSNRREKARAPGAALVAGESWRYSGGRLMESHREWRASEAGQYFGGQLEEYRAFYVSKGGRKAREQVAYSPPSLTGSIVVIRCLITVSDHLSLVTIRLFIS